MRENMNTQIYKDTCPTCGNTPAGGTEIFPAAVPEEYRNQREDGVVPKA